MEPEAANVSHDPQSIFQALPAFSSQALTIVIPLLVAVVCFALFVLLTQRKSASRGNALLLVGPQDAGKTAILSMLSYRQTLPTLTSLHTNSSVAVLSDSKALRVIDFPGHPRIRDQFREHLLDAKAVAFVVDSSTISRNGATVAEHLHHILHALTSLPPSQKVPTLLILAHKTDLIKSASSLTPDSQAITRVKTILERELEKRASQSGSVGIEGLGAEGERSEMGGLECSGSGPFRFADWEGGEVTVLATSVHGKRDEVDDEKNSGVNGLSVLRQWLHEIQ